MARRGRPPKRVDRAPNPNPKDPRPGPCRVGILAADGQRRTFQIEVAYSATDAQVLQGCRDARAVLDHMLADRAAGMRAAGKSNGYIAQRLKVDPSTVSRMLAEHEHFIVQPDDRPCPSAPCPLKINHAGPHHRSPVVRITG